MSRTATALWIAVLAGSSSILQAEPQATEEQAVAMQTAEPEIGDSGGDRRPESPYEAYEAGLYDEALKGFVDLQVERPDDPEVALNVGSAH